MFFKGKKAQGAAAGAASRGSKILGGLLKTGRGAKIAASKIKPLASAGFSQSAMAAGAIGGAGLGFILGRNKPGQVAQELVSSTIFLAIAVDIIGAVAFSRGGNPMAPLIAHVIFFWYLRSKGSDTLLNLAFVLNLFPLVMIPSVVNAHFDWLQYKPLLLTIGNGIFPVWTIYIGFLRNPQKSLIQKIVFWFFLLGFLGWGIQTGIVAGSYEAVQQASPEQIKAVEDFFANLAGGVINVGKGAVKTVTSIPDAVGTVLSAQIAEAGGEELYGEPKERPKLGIVIQDHPYGLRKLGDEKIAKAVLFVPNLPDENFLEISDVTCLAGKDAKPIRADELKERLDGGEKIRIFYNSPMTVTCTFTEENTDDFEAISSVELSVKYDFEENAKLITYLMREDLREELKSRGEEPLDFMAVPRSKRNPTTVYDNGPARIGIGPVDLTTPPFGIGPGLTYPDFELVIGNKPDFNGAISSISSIDITLPEGFALEGPKCAFAGNNPYSLKEDVQEENKLQFENIKSSRYFNCDMKINDNALGDASFAEVEFDVAVAFTYETTKTVRLKSS